MPRCRSSKAATFEFRFVCLNVAECKKSYHDFKICLFENGRGWLHNGAFVTMEKTVGEKYD